MAKLKACKECRTIFEGDKCPKCSSQSFSDSWKGRVVVMNPEQSDVAKKLKIEEKGTFAIKTR